MRPPRDRHSTLSQYHPEQDIMIRVAAAESAGADHLHDSPATSRH